MKVLVTGATGKVGQRRRASAGGARRRGAGTGSRPGPRGRRAAARGRDRARRRDRSGLGGERRRGLRARLQRDGHPRAVAAPTKPCSTASTRRERSGGESRARGGRAAAGSHQHRGRLPRRARRRFDESEVADYPKGTAYERSKQRAEQLALEARDGLEVVIVNPSRWALSARSAATLDPPEAFAIAATRSAFVIASSLVSDGFERSQGVPRPQSGDRRVRRRRAPPRSAAPGR